MAVVSIHAPLRMVSGSVTALQRGTTVVHVVDRVVPVGVLDGSPWQVRWIRPHEGHHRIAGEPTGELHVRTLCGKDIDGLLSSPQKVEPCKPCAKATREQRTIVLLHPPFWDEMCRRYLQEQLDKYKKKPKVDAPIVDDGQDDLGFNMPS